MAPIRNVPLGIVGAAIAVALYGCDLEAQLNGMVGVVCKKVVEQGIEKVSGDLQDQVTKKCAELKDGAMKQGLDEEKATQLHDKCMDATGMRVTEDADEQNTNYTEQCVHALKNATSGHMGQVNTLVQQFMKNLNMTQELHSIIQGHMTDTLKDVGALYNITLPADLLGAEEEVEEDAGKEDAGKEDAGKEDAGKEDAGKEDAGKEDAGKEDAGKEEEPTEEPMEVHTENTEEKKEQPKACCKASTAECLACVDKVSEEEYCKENPKTVGCDPEPKDVLEGEEDFEVHTLKDSRLFDGSISSIVRGGGSSVFACFLGGALVAVFGLVAMLRRRRSSAALNMEDTQEMLIDEDSVSAEAGVE